MNNQLPGSIVPLKGILSQIGKVVWRQKLLHKRKSTEKILKLHRLFLSQAFFLQYLLLIPHVQCLGREGNHNIVVLKGIPDTGPHLIHNRSKLVVVLNPKAQLVIDGKIAIIVNEDRWLGILQYFGMTQQNDAQDFLDLDRRVIKGGSYIKSVTMPHVGLVEVEDLLSAEEPIRKNNQLVVDSKELGSAPALINDFTNRSPPHPQS